MRSWIFTCAPRAIAALALCALTASSAHAASSRTEIAQRQEAAPSATGAPVTPSGGTRIDTPPVKDGPQDQMPGGPDRPPGSSDESTDDSTGDGKDDDRPPQTGSDDPGRGEPPTLGGLPDPLVILDILRRLPPLTGPNDDARDDDGDGPRVTEPETPGSRPPSSSRPPKPARVVNVPPNVPFKPAPAPRAPGSPPVIAGASGPEALDREVLVTLAPGSDDATVFALSQDLGLDGQSLYTSALLGSRVVRFRIPDTRSVADVVTQLSGDARIAIASPHYVYTASQGAAKPLPVPQYAPGRLKLSDAHKLARGKRVKVAVIDTAVDAAHPAFAGARISSFDALGGKKGAPEAHGTAIAGILGARSGLDGVAPLSDVLSVRAFAAASSGGPKSYTLAILKGLDWAALSGARVVNMSFAGPDDPILAQAIEAGDAKGMVLIAAAGNGGPKAKPVYPAAYAHVLAVTATDDRDGLYTDANRGKYIALAAPGVDIVAPAPGGAYDISSGTSLAAAHVSGIAALMLERNPRLSPQEIRDALVKSAQKIKGGRSEETGAGIADAARAVEAAQP